MRSDRFNPLLVRELRQMVRSRLIVLAIILYLTVLVGFFCVAMLAFLEGHVSQDRFGFEMFLGFLGIAGWAAGLGVVGYTAIRASVDRINEDLLFYTAISPTENVRGRLICGLVLTLLFFSMSLPFLTISYLFRGVDVWIFLVVIPIVIFVVQIVNIVALGVFSAVRSYLQWIFYAILFLAVLWLLGAGIIAWGEVTGYRAWNSWQTILVHFSGNPASAFSFFIFIAFRTLILVQFVAMPYLAYRLMRRWIFPNEKEKSFFTIRVCVCISTVLALVIGLILGVVSGLDLSWLFNASSISFLPVPWPDFTELLFESFLFLYVYLFFVPGTAYRFARCNLSPFSSNRMLPIRLWMSGNIVGTFFLGLLGAYFFPHIEVLRYSDLSLMQLWTVFAVGILSMMLILAVCERETWEGRLRRDIPKPIWRRALVFPFYTGSINGLLWVFLWTFFLTFFVSMYSIFLSSNIYQIPMLFGLLMFMMFVFDSSMTAFFLWKILFRRWMGREMIWTLIFALFAAIGFGLFFVELLFPQMLNEVFIIFAVPIIILWFFLIILCGYPWLRNRFLDFTPLHVEAPAGKPDPVPNDNPE